MTVEPLLALLQRCNNEDLDFLVRYILQKGGITNELDIDPLYEKHQPDHQKYAHRIAEEIRSYGGNTFANLARGAGPPYVKVARDVAKRLGVNPMPEPSAPVEDIEFAIVMKVLETAYEKMSEAEQRALLDELAERAGKPFAYERGVPLVGILAQAGVQLTGFAAYQATAIVANAVARFVLGRGLSLAANAMLMRSLATFAGPIGWAISAAFLAAAVASPAYRVTIPCVVHVAYLRRKKFFEDALGETL